MEGQLVLVFYGGVAGVFIFLFAHVHGALGVITGILRVQGLTDDLVGCLQVKVGGHGTKLR